MQTILGAGSAIGTELAKSLPQYTHSIRLVSRNPVKVNESDEIYSADLMDSEAVKKAVSGSDICYLTVGLKYDKKVWKRSWPVIMKNVIEACEEHNSKLVFFDNVYLYDPDHLNPMTEETPVNPSSEKGKVRAEIVKMLWDAAEKGRIEALVARSADFYGPGFEKPLSILIETVFKPLSQGSTANWLGGDSFKHSFTYTPDAGKATALLGNTPRAFGESWHLPTASNPDTGKEWVEEVAEAMNQKPKYRTVSTFIVRLMGLFMPIMRENIEMMYQYDRDYIFNSEKFEQKFNLKPTPYREGIRKVVETDFQS
ncbi:NAD-dependent epimerase/dehydratase family protein [Rhodohalobacter sulfatireducens]|uniref:NAD-dependent epimerase/dehydratase family protein n=1 Tax=Rhodohalobacter sulfatireducens TaxID=2911366 RepID=A0ABS9KH15_9BACT|nr:NAD-dependent epimerase/dehydratase family protein [Rhodohalobacter sulfatireducens]MCG2590133.1 NAD-dependent epimerase/dehydratase family protein [Rhodohalobacter sulfatireducens]